MKEIRKLRDHIFKPFLSFSLTLAFLVIFIPVIAEEGEVDHLALAQMFIRDGQFARAEKSLRKISIKESSDPALFTSLQAMLFLQKGDFQQALQWFNKSLRLGMKDKEIYLYQAEAHLQMGHFSKAQNSLEQTALEDRDKLPYFLLRTELAWRTGQKADAFSFLNSGLAKGLSPVVLNKKKFSYLLQEGLFNAAEDLAFKMLGFQEAFNDVLAMASQLRLKGQHGASLNILQALQIIRPDKETVALEIAQNYLFLGESFSAALVMEESVKHNPSLSYEAAELMRKIGKNYRAQFINLSTLDPEKKLKQKLALYLEDDDYHSLKFMIPQFRKYKLDEQDEIRYALAYSLYRTGDFNQARRFLDQIEKEELFEKSVELKKEIDHCEKERWACSETI